MSQQSLFFCQQFLSSITPEVKPIVLGQEDSSYWHFDNIFCRLNGYRKVIILEAIYQQSEKVQYQRQLTTTVKTNIFQRQITNTRFVRCYRCRLKQKTQGFGQFWCNLQQKSTEMTKNKGETIIIYNPEIKEETFKTLQNG